jgi:hypothetical protein
MIVGMVYFLPQHLIKNGAQSLTRRRKPPGRGWICRNIQRMEI